MWIYKLLDAAVAVLHMEIESYPQMRQAPINISVLWIICVKEEQRGADCSPMFVQIHAGQNILTGQQSISTSCEAPELCPFPQMDNGQLS